MNTLNLSIHEVFKVFMNKPVKAEELREKRGREARSKLKLERASAKTDMRRARAEHEQVVRKLTLT